MLNIYIFKACIYSAIGFYLGYKFSKINTKYFYDQNYDIQHKCNCKKDVNSRLSRRSNNQNLQTSSPDSEVDIRTSSEEERNLDSLNKTSSEEENICSLKQTSSEETNTTSSNTISSDEGGNSDSPIVLQDSDDSPSRQDSMAILNNLLRSQTIRILNQNNCRMNNYGSDSEDSECTDCCYF